MQREARATSRRENAVLPFLILPSRILPYLKATRGESNIKKGKRSFAVPDTAEPKFVLFKGNARREQHQEGKTQFCRS